MSVIINGVYRYQTVAVEGKSRMYVTALDRQREVLKKLISKNKLTIENFIFSERKVAGVQFVAKYSIHLVKKTWKHLSSKRRKKQELINGKI